MARQRATKSHSIVGIRKIINQEGTKGMATANLCFRQFVFIFIATSQNEPLRNQHLIYSQDEHSLNLHSTQELWNTKTPDDPSGRGRTILLTYSELSFAHKNKEYP